MINLGSDVQQITVILADDADYVVTLVASSAWPTGIVIYLSLSDGADGNDTPVVWTATVVGTQATFNVPNAQVQPVIDAKLSIARLYYTPAGGGPLLWGYGGIRVI